MRKYSLILLCGFIWSCKKDEPPVKEDITVTGNNVAVVSNEGNFLTGNASLSKIDLDNGNVDNDVYFDVNAMPLGDVCQSISFSSNRAYIVVNNSQKIVACNPATWQTEFTITGFNSPRHFKEVTPGKAYVTDIYEGKIAVVNLITQQITSYIPCNGASEEMLVSGQYAFITRPSSYYVKVINIFTDVVVDSILTGYGSNSIVQDANGKIWVLCGGDAGLSALPQLVRINPVTLSVENSLSFSSAATSPYALTINRTYDTLIYLNDGVYSLPVVASAVPSTPVVAQASGSSFYGVDVHPYSGQLFICDAMGFTQQGKIHRYKMNGTFLASYTVGYIPNNIYFP
jgi:hypothetical protein